MITKEKIDTFIQQIPPTPKILQETMNLLNKGELSKAAAVAEQDIALKSYLKSIVNKPIYGFRSEVSDIAQIFGILGVSQSQKTVYNYMLTLLSPKKWSLFKLNLTSFTNLQDELSMQWLKILEHLKIQDKDIESAITLLPASIIVAEALFNEKKEDVTLIRSTKDIDYNTILKRLTGQDLFDISESIAKKWEMPEITCTIVQAASGVKPSSDKDIDLLGKWMHLLLFFALSQPAYIEAQLNDFIEFQVEYVQDIYEEFMQVMDIQ